MRSRLLSLPYGDQALALRAATYRAVGGLKPYSMMVISRLCMRLSPSRPRSRAGTDCTGGLRVRVSHQSSSAGQWRSRAHSAADGALLGSSVGPGRRVQEHIPELVLRVPVLVGGGSGRHLQALLPGMSPCKCKNATVELISRYHCC